jgi:hypothetical protein
MGLGVAVQGKESVGGVHTSPEVASKLEQNARGDQSVIVREG